MKHSALIIHLSSFRNKKFAWLVMMSFALNLLIPVISAAQQPLPEKFLITRIQASLEELGYNPGPIDGLMGKKTAAAIRAFQQEKGIAVSGKASSRLFMMLQQEIAQTIGTFATLRDVNGNVSVNGMTATSGATLQTGDVIGTSAMTTASLEYADGSRVTLEEQTTVVLTRLSKAADGSRVSLLTVEHGKVRALLSNDYQEQQDRFEIMTPNSMVDVGLTVSQPDVEVSYDPAAAETIALSTTVGLSVKNFVTDEEKIIPAGTLVLISALGIKMSTVAAATAGTVSATTAGTTAGASSGAASGTVAAGEAATTGAAGTTVAGETTATTQIGAESAATESTTATGAARGSSTIAGISTKTALIGVGALAVVGVGAAALGGGDDGGDDLEPTGQCNDMVEEGGDIPETHVIELGKRSGTFNFEYQTYNVRDQMTVEYNGTILFDTGCVGTGYWRSQDISFSGKSSKVTINVYPNCGGGYYTAWDFIVHCPY